MNRKFLLGLLIAGIIAAYPLNVQADGHWGKCKKEEQSKTCKLTKFKEKVKLLWEHQETLKVTDAQLEKIKDIKHAALKKLIQFKADKEIVMVDLKSHMWADVIDFDKISPLIDEKYAAKANSSKTYTKAVSDIQKILNENQRSQWKEMCKALKYSKCDSGKYQKSQCAECVRKGSTCSRCAGKHKICPITGKMLSGDK